MSVRSGCLCVAVLAALCLQAGAFAQAAPKVVSTEPAMGATDVDPALTELRIVFDQNMAPGYAVLPGAPEFPTRTANPYFVDLKTCVLPVTLEAGKSYELLINTKEHLNFRNRNGVPVEPVVWRFRTRGTRPWSEMTSEERVALNTASLEEVERAILNRYSYRDLRKIDWTGRFVSCRQKAVNAHTMDDWIKAVSQMLEVTRDYEICIVNQGARSYVDEHNPEPNWADRDIAGAMYSPRMLNNTFAVGSRPDGIAYLSIGGMDSARGADYEAFGECMKLVAGAKVIIVDLRANAGGDESLGPKVAGWFTDTRVLYARRAERDILAAGGWKPVEEMWLDPAGPGKYCDKPLIVLSGPRMRNAAELMLLMFKACPNVTVLGAPTCGSIGNPRPVTLSNGVTLYLPSCRTTDPDDVMVQDKGVQPDIYLNPDPTAFRSGDPIFQRALEMAKEIVWGKDE